MSTNGTRGRTTQESERPLTYVCLVICFILRSSFLFSSFHHNLLILIDFILIDFISFCIKTEIYDGNYCLRMPSARMASRCQVPVVSHQSTLLNPGLRWPLSGFSYCRAILLFIRSCNNMDATLLPEENTGFAPQLLSESDTLLSNDKQVSLKS